MFAFIKKIKDKLFWFFAEKNERVWREYRYIVITHLEEHTQKPWKHWFKLMYLNWHYRILKKTSALYYKESLNTKTESGDMKTNTSQLGKSGNNNVSQPEEKPKSRLPYMKGPESELSKRMLSVHFAMRLLPYDIVSFDIFDTLVLRPFSNPKDLFYIVGKRLNMPEFYNLRIEAEKKAKEFACVQNGSREVTIYEIYEIIERKTGLPKDIGVMTEFEVEFQYCKANPYMKQIFDMLLEQRKTIIIVSDMYLPSDMMGRILENCGYSGYEKLYVSCEYGYGKNTKGLYQHILRDYQGKNIVHIGDNVQADIKCAEESGIKAIYYKNVNEIGGPYRAGGMTELVGAAYAGIVNNYLHNGIKKYNTYYEYGFIYGGLYVFGFCNWIHEKAKKEGVEKILFLARDGAIYQRVFQTFFGDIPSEYFLWSRSANSKYTFMNHRFCAYENAISSRIRSKNSYLLGEFLEIFELDALKKYLPEYGLKNDTLILRETLPRIERLFSEKWIEIEHIHSEELEQIKRYINLKIGKAKRAAFVDIGWVGNGPMGLKYLVEQVMNNECEIRCWQAAAISSRVANIAANQLDNTIESYLFSMMHNRHFLDAVVDTNKGLNHMFFEMLTQDMSPSFLGIRKDGSYSYQLPEVENYAHIESIQQGIGDFCRIYHELFQYDSYMYNISSADAFAPFRMAIRDVNFFKRNLSDFTFSWIVGVNDITEINETVGMQIKKAGC